MGRSPDPTDIYEVMDNGRLVLEYWEGTFDHHEVAIHSKKHLSDARINPGASALVDARNAQFGIAREDVSNIVAGLYANCLDKLKIGKCAILVNERTYDLARAYERSAGKYGINVIVFNSLDVACLWLGIGLDTVSAFLERMKTLNRKSRHASSD